MSKSTEYLIFRNKAYCAYCGKELERKYYPEGSNTAAEYYQCDCKEAAEYYQCDCKEALLEKSINEKIDKLSEEVYEIRKSLPKRHLSPDDFIKQSVLDSYVFTEKQIENIKWALAQCNPQTEFFEGLIYGCPDKTVPGYVLSESEYSADYVNINLGFYEDGKFYYYPVQDGQFVSPKLIHGNIIGIIPYNHKKKSENNIEYNNKLDGE